MYYQQEFFNRIVPKETLIYFADLTPYSYHGAEKSHQIVNVGLLSEDHDFPRGAVPQEFVDQLDRLIAAPTNLFVDYIIANFARLQSHTSRRTVFIWSSQIPKNRVMVRFEFQATMTPCLLRQS